MAAVNRLQEHEAVAGSASMPQSLQTAVEDYPIALVAATFVLGLGVGAMIGCAIADSTQTPPEHLATRLGRRVMDSLSDYIPESFRG
jgi:hypothetical protein